MKALIAVAVVFLILAVWTGNSRSDPVRTPELSHSRGGHALVIDRHGVGGGVISLLPPVVG